MDPQYNLPKTLHTLVAKDSMYKTRKAVLDLYGVDGGEHLTIGQLVPLPF
jgi:hypothetical protein